VNPSLKLTGSVNKAMPF